MAYTQQQVDDWFSANPDATPDMVAKTVQQLGGLNANAGLSDMLAKHYGSTAQDVNQYYNNYTAPATGGLPTNNQVTNNVTSDVGGLPAAPADNITSTGGVMKSATAPTSGAVSNVVEGDNIDKQISQRPEEISHWARSADQRYMELIDDKTGQVLDKRSVGDFSDVDLVKMGLSMVPGAGQVLGAVSALDAARKGDVLGAVIGGTGLVPGMQNVNTALRVGQAASSGNTLGALTALAGNSDLQKLTGANDFTVGGYTAKDAMSAANLATAAQNGQWANVISNAGSLVNSPDTVLAGKALAILQAAESGNPSALTQAVSAFNSSTVGSNNKSTLTSGLPASNETTVGNFEDNEVTRLKGLGYTKEQIQNYFDKLDNTTSALDMVDTGAVDKTSTPDTDATRSLTGTNTDFVNSEFARLKALGYTKEQISDYFDKLDALTSNLDSNDTTGGTGKLTDAGSLTVTGNKDTDTTNGLDSVSKTKTTDLGGLTITGDKTKDLGNLIITGDKPTGLDTVNIVADKPTVINNDDGTNTTITIVDNKVVEHNCKTGYHWDEAAQACVPDEDIVDVVDKKVTHDCGEGYHWDEASQSCVKDTVVVNPPVVNPPVVPPKKTTTSPLDYGVGTPAPKLDSSPQYLAGASPQKRMELAKLQQLFASLTPEMAAVLSERGFEPPKYREDTPEAPAEKSDSYFGNLSDELYNPKSKFMATGGSVFDSMMPKFIDSQKSITAAPVVGTGGIDSPLKLGVIKHLQQGVGRPMKQLGGLAHGGLPEKYEKAAPKGHKPEFITGLTGYYAQGDGTGQSDDIPAMLHDGDYVIDADAVAALGDGSSKAGAEALANLQKKVPHEMSTGGEAVPAQIADGEYVFPAAFVSAIGGGDNKKGAKMLDAMREELRAHKRSAPLSKIPPKAKSPLQYIQVAQKFSKDKR